MAILAEGISVFLKKDSIVSKYPGGWDTFINDVPNKTLIYDDNIARVGFMTPDDVGDYIDHLEKYGFQYIVNNEAIDLVVVDQLRGLCANCTWLEALYFFIDNDPKQRVTACQSIGEDAKLLYTPDDWEYENSLSQKFGFVPTGQEDKSLEYLGHDNGVDVYKNLLTGEIVYIGRS